MYNKTTNHLFSVVPRTKCEMSTFRQPHRHCTTMDASYLIPIYYEEVLPSDTLSLDLASLCRMATPIYPVMDNVSIKFYKDN